MNGETELTTKHDGNVLHCRSGIINLLLVAEGEQARFIHIKNMEHLMRTCCHEGYKERRYCPYCRKGIWCKDETFEDHLMRKHFSTTSKCNLYLPGGNNEL